MPETTALGAAMAAGAAEGVNVWNLSSDRVSDVTSTTYEPQINPEGEGNSDPFCRLVVLLCPARPVSYVPPHPPSSSSPHTESELRFARWKKAVQRAMNWETSETSEASCDSNGTL